MLLEHCIQIGHLVIPIEGNEVVKVENHDYVDDSVNVIIVNVVYFIQKVAIVHEQVVTVQHYSS